MTLTDLSPLSGIEAGVRHGFHILTTLFAALLEVDIDSSILELDGDGLGLLLPRVLKLPTTLRFHFSSQRHTHSHKK